MSRASLMIGLAAVLVLALLLGVALGEVPLSAHQYAEAFRRPLSPPGEILWALRAPRVVAAAIVGAALGLSGAVMQGLLRNPLAEPGVLGVSAGGGLGAAAAIAAGLAVSPGAVEPPPWPAPCWPGSPSRRRGAVSRPEALILFGVALSAFGGALTALVFNLSPSPMPPPKFSWLMGSVANRDWVDILRALAPMAAGLALCL